MRLLKQKFSIDYGHLYICFVARGFVAIGLCRIPNMQRGSQLKVNWRHNIERFSCHLAFMLP